MSRRGRSTPSQHRDGPTDDNETSMRTNAATGRHATTRRRFLRASAAAGALVGAGGIAGAQSQPTQIRLGGEIGGWKGRKPEPIADESNPTLQLDAGVDYRITWKNIDGQGHNIALLDGKGEVLKRTEVMNEQGATQTIAFTAREEMTEYICEPHRSSMHGSIAFGEETATRTTTESGGSSSYFGDGPTVRIETVTEGTLTAPLDFGVPPGESGRYFIADRIGQVYVHESGSLNEEPFIDVSDKLTEITGEMGLLGMAFHPNFADNRKFYLRYSAPSREGTPDEFSHTEVLSEFEASEDGSTGNVDSERTILEIPSPYDTHNAGAIVFGPDDGYLYVAMGDGGGAHDTDLGHVSDWYDRNEGGNGQDVTENLLGSILRIDVDSQEGDKAYGIPDDNPLVGRDGLNEQFAWGFRNPWRMGFSDGKLFTSDVGQNGFEEIDIVEKNKNYGWNVREGTHCFKPGPEGSRNPPENCPSKLPSDVRGGEQLIDPVIEYPHSADGQGVGSAAMGGYLYQRDAIPELQGDYVFGDFRKSKETETPTGSLLAATPAEDDGLWDIAELSVENTDSGFVGGYILAMGRDNDDRLYVLTTANPGSEATGAVHRIVPPQSQGATATGNATAPNGSATTLNATATTNTTAAGTTGVGRTDATTSSTDGTSPRTATEGTQAGGEGGVSAGTSSDSGPGFGVLAALSGLTIGAARLLSGREE
ncbi:PQQ-dependent sugar dehydrogenase [Halococcus dombrowskii]|uniref:PQQ-dependent sugar dehydrogenase n=1 Tax=Halococcus dombrowskii TaxID=179637 RepID=A0AAV3SLM1_HALDO|nr:PQQ-dependent sugar dehydrogenase [Halococcus dombrowskii]UOO94242.1 PQQ-dependent sugar dehydrogenase [Halococcus dombrowskii]